MALRGEMVERNLYDQHPTWPQVGAGARADQGIIIPFTSIDRHRPHLPADVAAALEAAAAAVATIVEELRARAIVVPQEVEALKRQAIAPGTR